MGKKLWIFIAISFSFSWLIALIIYLTGMYSNSQYRLILTILLVGYMFGPAVGAIVSQKLTGGKVSELGVNFKFNTWWIWGIIAILSVVILTVVVSFILGAGINLSWDKFRDSLVQLYKSSQNGEQLSKIVEQIDEIGKTLNYNVFIFYLITLLSGIVAGITINALAAFGEELGWRGFLFEEFKKFGFVKSSLVIGFIWGVWHAPIIAMGHNFPQHPFEGIFLMIIFCTALSFIMNYFREKTGSVVLSSMMHGTLNGNAGLYLYANSIKNDIIYNLTGISGIISILIIIAILYLDRKVFISKGE